MQLKGLSLNPYENTKIPRFTPLPSRRLSWTIFLQPVYDSGNLGGYELR
jgi:hypothetical protein